ncbi:hypothetical protein TD95_005106 [Thielaviopsis punctulata]|uniref:Transcription factor IIIC subunit 5 HTH domain-containing protein n=1 Tax=Thielaviopsis punctulata TaxID=72032 RepID=A0A0F4ZDL5_9PEZI|nr:hypothetical protein TD95_005106 [Thielaviopsis punctulata]
MDQLNPDSAAALEEDAMLSDQEVVADDNGGREGYVDTGVEAEPENRSMPSEKRTNTHGAPSFAIQPRKFGAVEVPMVVLNLDRVKKAFGRAPSFPELLEPNRNSLQLYLNPDSPFIPPVLSHNAATHNVLLKVTVPQRTGRRRKRGTDGPFEFPPKGVPVEEQPEGVTENNRSHGRLDHPKTLRRRLQDNKDKYTVEAVGVIKHTHRYKGRKTREATWRDSRLTADTFLQLLGLADFSWEPSNSDFSQRFSSEVLTGDVSKIKSFRFSPGFDRQPNADVIPPPSFTHMTLPFNYSYEQNPYVRAVRDEGGEERVMNITAAVMVGHLVKPTVDKVPTCPRMPPDLSDPFMVEIMDDLDVAFTKRPVWTRRSLMNHLSHKIKTWNVLKKYISYTAYQFKGGPFKDAVIAYGVDPRKDPKYRIYQTMFFKLPFSHDTNNRSSGDTYTHGAHDGSTGSVAGDGKSSVSASTLGKKSWHAMRKGQQLACVENESKSHIFDGQIFYSNGKLWQVCDITDPLLAEMFANAPVRPTCDITGSGWFHQGLWAKAKAIMKCKLLAIRFGRQLDPRAFDVIHATRDETPPPGSYISVKLPSLNLTDEELQVLRGPRFKESKLKRHKKLSMVTKNKVSKVLGENGGEDDEEYAMDVDAEGVEYSDEMEDDDEDDDDDDDDEDEDDEEDEDVEGDDYEEEEEDYDGEAFSSGQLINSVEADDLHIDPQLFQSHHEYEAGNGGAARGM